MNALLYELGHSNQSLSTREFNEVFAKTQRVRESRTKHLIDHATKMQSLDAMESVFAPLVVRFVIPNLTYDSVLAIVGENCVQGQRIESLPVPQRDRYVPYDDELPTKPLKNALVMKACFILTYLMLFYLAFQASSASEYFTKTLGIVLPERYTNALVDRNSTNGETSRNRQSHLVSSVIFLIPIILIWTIEGHRHGNLSSLGSWYVSRASHFVKSYS